MLTVGATANQNGTALYEGVTVLFLAQLAGFDLSMGQQLTVLYLCILGGIGTAGVPSGSIPFVIAVLHTVGIDPSLIAIIIGVDRILDMCRTAERDWRSDRGGLRGALEGRRADEGLA